MDAAISNGRVQRDEDTRGGGRLSSPHPRF